MDQYERVSHDLFDHFRMGSHHRARKKDTGEDVVIKVLRGSEENGLPCGAIRETMVLKHLQHPRIVKILDCFNVSTPCVKLYIVTEFVESNLQQYIDTAPDSLTPSIVKILTSQLMQAIDYCHRNGVLHRSISPRKLLITNQGELKLSGFGLSRCFVPSGQNLTKTVVRLWYRPPELLLGCKNYSIQVDMWSIGAVVAEMVIKTPLFSGHSEISTLFAIFRLRGTPNETTWPGINLLENWNADVFPQWPELKLKNTLPDLCADGVDLVERLLTLDPKKRITARDALSHPYVEGS